MSRTSLARVRLRFVPHQGAILEGYAQGRTLKSLSTQYRCCETTMRVFLRDVMGQDIYDAQARERVRRGRPHFAPSGGKTPHLGRKRRDPLAPPPRWPVRQVTDEAELAALQARLDARTRQPRVRRAVTWILWD